MIALLDCDLVAYRCAASCEKQGVVVEDFGIAQARADNLIKSILDAVEATDRKMFLSGGDNFRKAIYPQYKANRIDKKRPDYLEPLREYLVMEWGAKVTDGIEADDALGIAQTGSIDLDRGPVTVICSLDKDLLQVPGNHYSWAIGTATWSKVESHQLISPQKGLFNFYWQLMMGDAADNVPGFDGKMRQKVPKFMESHYEHMIALETEQELFDYVLSVYQLSDEQLLQYGACLWVQRYEGDMWLEKGKKLLEKSTTGGSGVRDASTPL